MSSIGEAGIFGDFDAKVFFNKCEASVLSVDTQNFVLEFNNTSAQCAIDVSDEDMLRILASERSSHRDTRWINIWAPETQQKSVKAIADHYGFSPRLLGLMSCEPLRPIPVPSITHHSRVQEMFHHSEDSSNNHDMEKSAQDRVFDLEGHLEKPDSPSRRTGPLDLNHYRIVNEVWHFNSVDWGHKFLCIGYNSLYHTMASLSLDSTSTRRSENKPAGKRVWTWLVLCNDGTVITIHENPYPKPNGPLGEEEQKNLEIIRRNLKNVFCQISTANAASRSPNPIMSLPLRSPKHTTDGKPHASASEIPSLLFYYLFDDWYTSYSLVARSEHQYGAQLEQLRARMFTTAELKHVAELHHFGRQLAVLKRIYQSYDNIIQRILEGPKEVEPQELTIVDPDQGPEALHRKASQQLADSCMIMPDSYSNPLLTAAKLKFIRLKDRINLYALTEIQDCLEEKEALVLLNFNLIAIKESSAVERLTRITILLAKVTILFMPVSLMTGYFSVQIADLQGVYTHNTYWLSFCVIMALSIIFLVVFGQLSGTQEGAPIYRSLTRVFFDKSKALYDSRTTPKVPKRG